LLDLLREPGGGVQSGSLDGIGAIDETFNGMRDNGTPESIWATFRESTRWREVCDSNRACVLTVFLSQYA
jgi:hypothetical protein